MPCNCIKAYLVRWHVVLIDTISEVIVQSCTPHPSNRSNVQPPRL